MITTFTICHDGHATAARPRPALFSGRFAFFAARAVSDGKRASRRSDDQP
jgi:hypothetical protein